MAKMCFVMAQQPLNTKFDSVHPRARVDICAISNKMLRGVPVIPPSQELDQEASGHGYQHVLA